MRNAIAAHLRSLADHLSLLADRCHTLAERLSPSVRPSDYVELCTALRVERFAELEAEAARVRSAFDRVGSM